MLVTLIQDMGMTTFFSGRHTKKALSIREQDEVGHKHKQKNKSHDDIKRGKD